jgi:hypothetical protein
LFHQLLKRAGKEAVEVGRAPAGDDGQASEVPRTDDGDWQRSSPSGRGAATSQLGDVKASAAMERDAPRQPEDVEGLVATKEDAPRPMEAAAVAEVPKV